MTGLREPTAEEMSIVDQRLAELRREFPGPSWSDSYEDEYDLLGFAYYEGCDRTGALAVMVSAVPYAVGKSLVRRHGFSWVMVRAGESWHHGVVHPLLREPIDLMTLEDGAWYRPYTDDEPPRPGETTWYSHDFIEMVVMWKRVAGVEAPVPEGDPNQIYKQIKYLQALGYPRPAR